MWGSGRWYEVSRQVSLSDNIGVGVMFHLYGDVERFDAYQTVRWRLREGSGFLAIDSGSLASWAAPGGWNGTIQPSMTWCVCVRTCIPWARWGVGWGEARAGAGVGWVVVGGGVKPPVDGLPDSGDTRVVVAACLFVLSTPSTSVMSPLGPAGTGAPLCSPPRATT